MVRAHHLLSFFFMEICECLLKVPLWKVLLSRECALVKVDLWKLLLYVRYFYVEGICCSVKGFAWWNMLVCGGCCLVEDVPLW